MRVRELGRWVGRLLTVAVFGAGATLGLVSGVAADESGSAGGPAESPSESEVSPEDYTWD